MWVQFSLLWKLILPWLGVDMVGLESRRSAGQFNWGDGGFVPTPNIFRLASPRIQGFTPSVGGVPEPCTLALTAVGAADYFFFAARPLGKSAARRIVRGRFKADHGFIGPGVAEFFAGEAFDGFRIAAERVKFRLKLPGLLPLFFQLRVQPVNPAAHLLVLLDERQVGHPDEQQNGNGHEGDDRLREPAPDAEINFHPASLKPRAAEAKADFIVMPQTNCLTLRQNDQGFLSDFRARRRVG